MIIFGRNVLIEAIKVYYPINEIRITPEAERELAPYINRGEYKKVTIKRVDRRDLDDWTEGTAHQGVAANAPDLPECSWEDVLANAPEGGSVVFLDQIQDPRNFGAIARTALAMGAKGLVVQKRRSAPVSGVSLKASAGAFFRLKTAYETNLARAIDRVKDAGYWVYGADINAEKGIDEMDFSGKTAIVLGAEGEGMRQLVASKCDFSFRIPMREDVESLNVSVAAGIVLYEVFKRKRKSNPPS